MADAGVGRSVRQTADGRLLPKGVGAPDEDSSDDEEDDGGDSSDDDEGEGQHKRMEAPARATKPEPDEDGWTTVPVRRGRRRTVYGNERLTAELRGETPRKACFGEAWTRNRDHVKTNSFV